MTTFEAKRPYSEERKILEQVNDGRHAVDDFSAEP